MRADKRIHRYRWINGVPLRDGADAVTANWREVGFPENLGEEFDSPFARLDWTGRDRFDIQWFRHTGTWHRLYRDVSLAEALKILETDGILHPL